jgi:hypothetical protein
MTHVLALTALQRAGDPTAVQRLCVDISRRWDGAAIGLILVRPDGATILAHASEHMSWARAVGDAPISGGLAHPADAHP